MRLSSRKSSKIRRHEPIGSLLRRQRSRRNLTQKEVAKILGVGEMFVSKIERNQCGVPPKHLKKLIALYDLNRQSVIQTILRSEKNRLEKLLK